MTLFRSKKYLALLTALLTGAGTLAQSGKGASVLYSAQDSAVTYASNQYEPHSFLRRLFMGGNYRREWRQEVTVPVLHLSGSGFTVKELGGGMQTKSLHLVDSHGKEWGLRTVEKYITNASVTRVMRNRIGRNLSQDLISASFPYAAPLAGELAGAAGIRAARPRVFYVAGDAALGRYDSLFAGTLCTLEERDPGFDSTNNSTTLYLNLRRSNAAKMQQPVYLRARLLDMLVADWDRHADNWRWGTKDSAGFRYYYAVPRDRDWAFYDSGGWIPKLAQFTGNMRCLIPFEAAPKNIKMLSWKAWKMDENFLNELNAAAWKEVIHSFQSSLTDEAIEKAVQVLPASLYASDGGTFVQKLKSRRDGLEDAVMKYYRFLAENAVINGSDEAETFVVTMEGAAVKVTVYGTAAQRLLYQRTFSPAETYSLTLNGFGGADAFEITEDVKSKIRFIINGGEGRDSFNIKGDVRCRINDDGAIQNNVLYQGRATLNVK